MLARIIYDDNVSKDQSGANQGRERGWSVRRFYLVRAVHYLYCIRTGEAVHLDAAR